MFQTVPITRWTAIGHTALLEVDMNKYFTEREERCREEMLERANLDNYRSC